MITTPQDMRFSREPTARSDEVAAYVREWYEANREGWWDRHRSLAPARGSCVADNFMMGLIGRVNEVHAEAMRQDKVATGTGDNG